MTDDYAPEPGERITAPEERSFRGEYTFRGKTLKPFSHVRQTAAVELGLKYGVRVDADDMIERRNPKYDERQDILRALEEDSDTITEMGGAAQLSARAEELKDEPEFIVTYEGLMWDASLVLWLCSQPDSTCRRARRQPDKFEAEIDKWADQNGITMNGDSLAEAYAVFSDIMNDTAASRGEPVVEGGNDVADPN